MKKFFLQDYRKDRNDRSKINYFINIFNLSVYIITISLHIYYEISIKFIIYEE